MSKLIPFLLSALVTTAGQAATLEVQVSASAVGQGAVMLALYDKADGWMKAPLRGAKATVAANGATVLRFENLPDGDYAISALLDTNGNGKMDFNVFGIPLEAFGFSNKAVGSFGPPKFEAARFTVKGDTVHLIDLQ